MKDEILIAGFGGQGVLSMGKTLAYAGMVEGKEVSWMPSYGPEMRGGTANCTVIISDDTISSPIINSFDMAVILNQPSMEKFERFVKPNGNLLFESNNILEKPSRQNIKILDIPAVEEAVKLQNSKIMNMIMLGSILAVRPIVTIDSVLKALKKVLPERHHHLLPLNEKALERGAQFVEELTVV